MKKIAVFLVLCLFSQSLAFAQTQSPRTKPTLAQVQEQARQDVEKKPWIKKEGYWLLGTLGVSAGLLALQALIHRTTLKRIATEESIRRIATAEISRELTQAKGAVASLERENIRLNNMNHDLLEGREYFKGKISELENKVNSEKFINNALRKREYDMRLDLAEFEFFDLADIEKIEKQAKPIARKLLNGQALTEAETNLLLQGTDPQVAQEISQVLQKNKGNYVALQNTLETIAHAHPEKISYKSMRLFQKVFREIKGPLALGLVLSLFINTNTAQAQEWEYRLNHNFDLFLQASPQELAEIERLGLAELCIEGAKAIHEMAEMDEYTQQEIQSVFNEPKAQPDLRQVSSY
ncbi:MAG: hypothetical protein IKC13_06340 [Elusimicrobiaceae bacterium]|nr:hypothetical protein [Elusimicrobiaceae bacterium]